MNFTYGDRFDFSFARCESTGRASWDHWTASDAIGEELVVKEILLEDRKVVRAGKIKRGIICQRQTFALDRHLFVNKQPRSCESFRGPFADCFFQLIVA